MPAKPAISDVIYHYTVNTNWVSWRTRDARYHFFLNDANEYNGETLYKNALVNHGEPGYSDTRKLDGMKAHNAYMIACAMDAVKRCDMINKAKAAYEAEQAAAEQAQFQLMERRERARELFKDMRTIASYNSGQTMTLDRTDMDALLSFAPDE